MTNRVYSLIVVLEHDYREDDVETLCYAIRQLRGVAGVQPNVSNIAWWSAMERARWEVREKVIAALNLAGEPPE